MIKTYRVLVRGVIGLELYAILLCQFDQNWPGVDNF